MFVSKCQSLIDNCRDDVMSGFDDVLGLDFNYFIYLSVFGIKEGEDSQEL